jgi:hypothetical protein
MSLEPSPCSNCKDNYWPEDLIWADTGGLRWLCQECYNAEQQVAVPYCGDCLRPINECHHGKGN